MDGLFFAEIFRKRMFPPFPKASHEDQYYRFHEPKSRETSFSVATTVAIVGFLVLTLNLLPG